MAMVRQLCCGAEWTELVHRLASHESNMLKTDNTSLIRQNGRFRDKLKYGH